VSAPLLTKKEVAERLTIATRTVLQLASRGKLASIKVGACVRFEPAAVEAFIEANRRTVTAPTPYVPPVMPSPLPKPRKDYFA
jgi:excisionase family DNA binding protein